MIDKYFSGVSKMLINNELYRQLIWHMELLLFSRFLRTKLTAILRILLLELIL